MHHLWIPAVSNDNGQVIALIKYLAMVISEGDYLNDWVTHLPLAIQPSLIIVGKWMALLFS